MADKPDISEASLRYHQFPQPGKIETGLSKPCETQAELALAYTPGVATPCNAIHADPATVWEYTGKGNAVAVVSDGTAVLGLGNIGPDAAMPVMEGKAVLFKRFADIDATPVCLTHVFTADGHTDTAKLIEVVATFEPTYGGINLEDIAGPACFEVEAELKRRMGIPVFHDDQHGTAIISLAGVLNALKLVGKRVEDVRVTVNGAGAAGIACSEFYISAGVRRENVIICDSKGVVYKGRAAGMTPQKERLAADTRRRTLADAIEGADVFVGLSVADCVTPAMVKRMAPRGVIFAMANPAPEIHPGEALAAGAAVVGTGRTDFPNQVNNVLGFPGIFRGALDVRARDINEAMKLAAASALVELAGEEVPADVRAFLSKAYPADSRNGIFDGRNPLKASYVIPKPFDPRVVPRVARKVAAAAMGSGVNRLTIDDLDAYEASVAARVRAKIEARAAARR
ncbi:MAG: NADP-dependent malic enzyme [Lentisphaerae bacterium ADurb.BinA184]|nr:MAG: NADP-dependent malic enzyme [Lentisphaerae bacterium ADurb.BinA184]